LRAFFIVAAAAFSHWLLDLIVHVRDLALWDDSYKVGFGLWNYFWFAFILEFVVLIGGARWYARKAERATSRRHCTVGLRRFPDACVFGGYYDAARAGCNAAHRDRTSRGICSVGRSRRCGGAIEALIRSE
jgi:hypothetical protein